jgi:MFS family permease
MVVEERLQGTAYGLVTCTYNITLILIPTIVGYIIQLTHNDSYYGFFWPGIFFFGMIFLSFTVILLLIYFDRKKFGKILNKLATEEEEEEEGIDEKEIWDELYNPSSDPSIMRHSLGLFEPTEEEDGDDDDEYEEENEFFEKE